MIEAVEIYDTWATVYKYRAFDRNALSILIDRELYFASSSQLNDPHDCQINISQTLVDALSNTKVDNWLQPELRNTLLRTAEEIARDNKIIKWMEDRTQQHTICSFSILADQPLLWSHYADQHRGFCLGFNPRLIREKIDGFDNIDPVHVDYTDDNPFAPLVHAVANSIYGSPDDTASVTGSISRFAVERALATKSLAWSYEKEFRFLRSKGETGPVKFDPQALTEIILGFKMSQRDRQTLLNLVRAPEFSHVRIREVTKSQSRMSFELVDT